MTKLESSTAVRFVSMIWRAASCGHEGTRGDAETEAVAMTSTRCGRSEERILGARWLARLTQQLRRFTCGRLQRRKEGLGWRARGRVSAAQRDIYELDTAFMRDVLLGSTEQTNSRRI